MNYLKHLTSLNLRGLTRMSVGNSRLAKLEVHYSADKFVVNQSSVLHINFCGKNRHLCQAPKRYNQA